MINVRGLSHEKFLSVISSFCQEKLDFCFIQESMICDKHVMDSFSFRWQGSIYWSPAVGRRGGVATFLSYDLKNTVISCKKETDRRFLSILVKFDSIYINLVNVYAPTAPVERAQFNQSVHSFFFPHSKYVVGEILIVMIVPLITSVAMFLLVQRYRIFNLVSPYRMLGERYTLGILSSRGSALASQLLVV